ncbi:MAG: hypothetical protein KGJ27_11100 [candidate division NC10 bacterium]|nr:hypothetical protein [candidate division NC10 bacterium]
MVWAWADKLTELEPAFETQQGSLQQLQREMQRLRPMKMRVPAPSA